VYLLGSHFSACKFGLVNLIFIRHNMYNIEKECHNSVFTYVPHDPFISTTGEASSEPHTHTHTQKVFTISISKKSHHLEVFL